MDDDHPSSPSSDLLGEISRWHSRKASRETHSGKIASYPFFFRMMPPHLGVSMKIAELRPHSDSQRPQARASSALLPSCGLAAAWKAKAAYYAITGSTRRRPGDDQSASSIEDQVHLVDAAPGVVPAATLSCLQAVCDAAAGRPFAVPGQVHEDQKSEAHDAPALERGKRASLMLKASVGHTGAMRAMCSLEHCKLTLSIDQRPTRDASVVVEVPLKELGVRLQQGLATMFTVATVRDNKMASDDICCFANNQTERDEWVSAFRSMGVPVFDVGEGTGKATIGRKQVRFSIDGHGER